MDPVTAIGLTASIVNIMDAAMKVVGIINDIKGATKEQAMLIQEVTGLLPFLSSLKTRIELANKTDPWFARALALGAPNGAIALLDVAIAELSRRLHKLYERNKVSRSLGWVLKKEECNAILIRIERAKSLITAELQGDIFNLSLNIKDDTSQIPALTKGIEEIRNGQHDLKLRDEVQRRHEVEQWLSPLNFFETQSDKLSRRLEGTGLVNDRGSRVLWAPGIPGAGKTMLAAIIVDDIQQRFEKSETVGVACIYCDYKDQVAQTTKNLLASLWLQLAANHPDLSYEVEDLYNKYKSQGPRSRPTLDEISRVLHTEVERYEKVYFIIDALDECSDENRTTLLRHISALPPTVSLMVTSRFFNSVPRQFQGAMKLEIEADVEDVKNYVRERINSVERLSSWVDNNPSLEEEIVTTVIKNAEKMFLLVKLHMDSLCSKMTVRDLRKALKTLPTGLEESYNHAMDRIDLQDQEAKQLAYRILYWISYTLRPLTVEELRHALGVEPEESEFDEENLVDEGDLIAVCAGLVTIEPESQIVRMVHYTAQDYFEKIRDARWPEACRTIAATCLAYLSYRDIEIQHDGYRYYIKEATVWREDKKTGDLQAVADVREDPPDNSWDYARSALSSHYDRNGTRLEFYDYAALYWPKHLRGKLEEELESTALRFLRDDQARCMAMSTLRFWWNARVMYDELCVAVAYDLQAICKVMVASGNADVESEAYIEDDRLEDALVFGGTFGRAQTAKMLMDIQRSRRDGDTENSPITSAVLTAAIEAAWSGNRATVCVLLDIAADYGHANKKKVGKLVSGNRATVGAKDMVIAALKEHRFDITIPLIAATGTEDCLTSALDQGWDIEDKEDRYGKTALIIAAEIGRTNIVRLLLARGANAEATDRWLETALHYASLNGNYEIVKMLLAAGADPEPEADNMQTPLQYLTFRTGAVPGDIPPYLQNENRFAEVLDLLLEAIEKKHAGEAQE